MRVISWKQLKNRTWQNNPKADNGATHQYLATFWKQFNQADTGRKIDLLKLAASRYFGGGRQQYASNRRKFDKNKKRFNWGDCLVCGVKAELVHHVIQIQYGGSNHRKNMAPLCHDCHAKIHPWLDRSSNGIH